MRTQQIIKRIIFALFFLQKVKLKILTIFNVLILSVSTSNYELS